MDTKEIDIEKYNQTTANNAHKLQILNRSDIVKS